MYNIPEYIRLLKMISSCQDLLELQDSIKEVKKFFIIYGLDKKSKEYEKLLHVIDLVRIKLSSKFKTC